MPFVGIGFPRFASDGVVTFGGVAANSAPAQPTITAGTLTSSGATLSGSAFSDPDVGDAHAASQWQVTTAADTGFATPLYNPGDDAVNKTSLVWSGGSASTDYLARVRYKDSAGNYSDWSTSASFTTAAGFSGQFREDWSSNSIRSTLWDATTNTTGTGSASAATGVLILSTSSTGPGTINVINPGSSGNRYDMTGAAEIAGGLVVDLQSVTLPANGYIAIEDATGLGFAFRINNNTTFTFGRLIAGATAIGTRFTVSASGTYVPATDRFLRFRYNASGSVELATSPNGVDSWAVKQTLANSAGVTLTAVGFAFGVSSTSSNNSIAIGTVTVN